MLLFESGSECYDVIAKKLGVDKPKTEIILSRKWKIHKGISPIDDTQSIYIYVEANETIPDRVGFQRVRPILVIRCVENKTAFMINLDTFLGTESVSMTYRIDKEHSVTSSWNISTDNKAVGRWGSGTSIPFIKRLFGKKQLITRITPYGENTVTVAFDIGGLKDAITPLRTACKW